MTTSGLPVTIPVAIVGAGVMGAGIAQVAARHGHTVLLYDAVEGAAIRGLENVNKSLVRLVDKGRLEATEKGEITSRIQSVNDVEELADAGLVIEAIIEDEQSKRDLFEKLETVCAEETIIATNTSSLSITLLASTLKRPQNFVGMHFFNPAPVMKLVEVVSGLATGRENADMVFATAEAWGKKAVHVKSSPGFIVNRVARPFYAEALRVLQERGTDIATIDAVMRESGGFRMGPFELMDLIGIDISYRVTSSVFNAFHGDKRYQPSLLQQELVHAGHLGRKTGRGFYNYEKEADRPLPQTMETGNSPAEVVVSGISTILDSLVNMIEQQGITVNRHEAGDCYLQTGEAMLALTDGRLASQRALECGFDNLVLFDLALDYRTSERIALAPADQCSDKAKQDAAGLFQALDKKVSLLDDVPGMIVMRTVAMLANEGADTVNQGVCDINAVDTAMQYGLNYPAGPMQWAEDLSLDYVVSVLDNLNRCYGGERYRVSPLLRRRALAT